MSEFINNFDFSNLIGTFSNYIGFKDPLDAIRGIIDISIVSYVIYKLIVLVKETRAVQLIKGIFVILAAAYISELFGLKTIEFILKSTLGIAAFAFVVLFQPELRRGLEQLGRSKFKDYFNFDEQSSTIRVTAVIEEVVKAATELSKQRVGALIVFERDTKLGDIINTGTELESRVTAELLINIFTPNTPLHDGAVIVRQNKIKAAGCFLPLTDNPNLSKELGTRHRAALGITEVSDSVSVVVSEETGTISFALSGGLSRNLTPDILRKALNKNLLEKNKPAKKLNLWKVRGNERNSQ